MIKLENTDDEARAAANHATFFRMPRTHPRVRLYVNAPIDKSAEEIKLSKSALHLTELAKQMCAKEEVGVTNTAALPSSRCVIL